MSGDVGFEERAIVMFSGADSGVIEAELREAGARVTHHYGNSVIISEIPDDRDVGERVANAGGVLIRRMSEIGDEHIGFMSTRDPQGLIGLQAFDQRQSAEYIQSKRSERTFADQIWDIFGLGSSEIPASNAASGKSVRTQLSARLTGRIAVGIIFVSGKTDALRITPEERSKIIRDIQNGLSWLGSQSSNSNLLWAHDYKDVEVDVLPDNSLAGEGLELLWRNPAMKKLNFKENLDGVKDYAQDLKTRKRADWAYCAFFTKYDLFHPGYALPGGPHLVMKVSNLLELHHNIDRIFVHETCHIFFADDEYESSRCKCDTRSGFFRTRNGNCLNCDSKMHLKCICINNSWNMCEFTQWQLGFNGQFQALYAQGEPGLGIGGMKLELPEDRAFAFDFDHSGKLDHLVLYRGGPPRGGFGGHLIFILRKNDRGEYFPIITQDSPIGGFDLHSTADRGFAYDYDSSGKLDHLVFYRPGRGAIFIVKNNNNGTFSAVYNEGEPGRGIGNYNLLSPADRAFAFDYESSGKCDHIVLYRPGSATGPNDNGAIRVVRRVPGTRDFETISLDFQVNSFFSLSSPADRIFAYDFNSSGKLDHLVFYRPGEGRVVIARRGQGSNFFSELFLPSRSNAKTIGGYELNSVADRIFAYDYNGTGKLDHLVLYRSGTGKIAILRRFGGAFYPVFKSETGIDGYDLKSRFAADRGFAFDFRSNGSLNNLVFYRPGTGAFFIMDNVPTNKPQPR